VIVIYVFMCSFDILFLKRTSHFHSIRSVNDFVLSFFTISRHSTHQLISGAQTIPGVE
jgi:hypothetical protein